MKAGRKKGTQKTGGRSVGTPNRTTKESKEFLKQILFAEFDNIQLSLKRAREESDSKYIDLLAKLLQFVLPKQNEVEYSGPVEVNVTFEDVRKK